METQGGKVLWPRNPFAPPNETIVEAITCVGIYAGIESFQGFLNGGALDFAHRPTKCNSSVQLRNRELKAVAQVWHHVVRPVPCVFFFRVPFLPVRGSFSGDSP